jgi:hypothetical protein
LSPGHPKLVVCEETERKLVRAAIH